ncbi:MAG: DUF4132 domain-containing protein [Myxococcota bacterium]
MWKKFLDAIGWSTPPDPTPEPAASEASEGPAPVPSTHEPSPPVTPSAPTDSRTVPPGSRDSRTVPPGSRDSAALFDLLNRVLREPGLAKTLAPSDLPKLAELGERAMSPMNPKRTLAVAYVWAHHAALTDAELPLLHAAVWSGEKWRDSVQLERVRELLQKLDTALAERVLLELPHTRDALRYFHPGCPTTRVAVAAMVGASSMHLRQDLPRFPADARDAIARESLSLPPPPEVARVLIEHVDDPTSPEWLPLFEIAVSERQAYVSAKFWSAFERLPEPTRVALALSGHAEPEAAMRAPHPEVAARAVSELASSTDARSPWVKVVIAQGTHAVAPLEAALAGAPPGRELLARALCGLGDAGVSGLLLVLADSRGSVRQIAREGLLAAPAESIEPTLTALLSSKRKGDRQAVLELLEARRDPLAVRLAARFVADERDAAIQERLGALGAAAPSRTASLRRAVDAIADPLVHQSLLSMTESALRLAWQRDSEETLARFAALAGTRLGHMAEAPFRRLLDLYGEPVLPALAIAVSLAHENPWRTRRILDVAPKTPEMSGLLLDASEDVNRIDSLTLGRIAETGPTDLVLRACALGLAQASTFPRAAAVEILVGLGGAALPLLTVELDASTADRRVAAATAMGRLDDPTVEALLQARLDGERSKVVRAALLRALRRHVVTPGIGTDALDSRLAAFPEPELPGWLDRSLLPALAWSDGTPMSDGARTWLLGACADASAGGPDADLVALAGRFDPTTTGALYDVLRTLHDPGAASGDVRWMLQAAGVLGTPAHRDALAATCDDRYRSGGATHGATIVEMLASVADRGALRWLDRWRRKARSSGLVDRCTQALEDLARERGMPVGALLEAALPDLGFAPDGTRSFPFGARTLDLTITADGLEISLEGKVRKSPPAARKDEDADAVKAARAELSALKKEVADFQALVRDGLENTMVSGRRWSREDWRTHVERPLVRPLARHVVFETGGTPFTVGSSGPLAADGRPVELGDTVGVAHPVDVALGAFEARVGPQPFPQIDRPTYTLADLDGLLASRTELDSRSMRAILERRGYHRGPTLDGGWVVTMDRRAGDLRISLVHSGFPIGEVERVTVEAFEVVREDRSVVDPATLDARTVSEMGADLAALP